jgi:hypothetical protein
LTLNNNVENVNNVKKERALFAPPSVEEVAKYCSERANQVNAQQFVDFYTAKGWVVGSSKMKDWQAAVRTWEQRQGVRPADDDITQLKQKYAKYN